MAQMQWVAGRRRLKLSGLLLGCKAQVPRLASPLCRCANFWGDSAPRQRNPPAKAYRRAFRGVLEGIIADKGYSVTITK